MVATVGTVIYMEEVAIDLSLLLAESFWLRVEKELKGSLLSRRGREGLPVGEGFYRPTMSRVGLMNRTDMPGLLSNLLYLRSPGSREDARDLAEPPRSR